METPITNLTGITMSTLIESAISSITGSVLLQCRGCQCEIEVEVESLTLAEIDDEHDLCENCKEREAYEEEGDRRRKEIKEDWE